ncbi:Cytochrome c554 and c-prime [Shimia haliotis]|uniref:Cytochrome c554 and c-prime n=2 Tax=Shimia haliotis TaxID=1280847 RepID=A0A1I4HGL3_9RHOB|nr:Cytochrome c554 and c-prime [Shimia haliotis]
MLQGAFEGEEFTHDGMTARFFRDGDDYVVDVTEKDGTQTAYTVHSVGGTHPLEHLIFETEPGRLQSFDVAWDVDKKNWFHLYPEQDLPPDDGYHWSGPYKNWNARCAECHATEFEKNYDFQTRSYTSVQSEIGVGCEACHGPGEAHLRQQEGEMPTYTIPLDQYGFSAALTDPQEVMEQCATCHSRREAFGNGNPLPGTSFHDAYSLALLRPGLYEPDGHILDEVYVYGSFRQSKMHEEGVTCVNCHDSHSAQLLLDETETCTQCHSTVGNGDFPTLKLADYDSAEHHFHEEGSEGARCVSCHMPQRRYMGNDDRRDHSFRIPRPDLFAQTSGPDACTDCHSEETPAWAAEVITQWHPGASDRDPGYALDLANARNQPQPLPEMLDHPGLVQATILWLFDGTEDVSAETLAPYLTSSDPVVRSGAMHAARHLPLPDAIDALSTGMQDPRRNVRVSAARAFLQLVPRSGRFLNQSDIRLAYSEVGEMFSNQMDFPEAHLQMGGLALFSRNLRAAVQSFREVVTLDPQNSPAWVVLVRIAYASEGEDAAKSVLEEAFGHIPDDPTLQDLASQL